MIATRDLSRNTFSLVKFIIISFLIDIQSGSLLAMNEDETAGPSRQTIQLSEWQKNNLYNQAVLIEEGKIDYLQDGSKIEDIDRLEIAAELYRQAGTPGAFYNLAILIKHHKTERDEAGNVIDPAIENEVVARLYRKSKIPPALYNLAVYIRDGLTTFDEEGNSIDSTKKYEAEARLYRKVRTPEAISNLGYMLSERKTNLDLNEKNVSSKDRFAIAAQLYRVAKCASAYHNLALLIESGKVNRDENNNLIDKRKHFEVVARLYRKSKLPRSLLNLGYIIYKRKVSQDENGEPLSSNEEFITTALRLFQDSDTPEGYSNMAIITLGLSSSLENKKMALVLFAQAIGRGHDAVFDRYLILQEDIRKIEAGEVSPPDEDETSYNEKEEKTEAHEEIESQKPIKESLNQEGIPVPPQKVKEVEEDNGFNLSLEARKRLKALKKSQKPGKQNHRFKKLLEGKLSEEEMNAELQSSSQQPSKSPIPIHWSNKALKQLQKLAPKAAIKVSLLIKALREGDSRLGRAKTLVKDTQSRRITLKDRLVYQYTQGGIEIISCKKHKSKVELKHN